MKLIHVVGARPNFVVITDAGPLRGNYLENTELPATVEIGTNPLVGRKPQRLKQELKVQIGR
jgi:hypothetical protein